MQHSSDKKYDNLEVNTIILNFQIIRFVVYISCEITKFYFFGKFSKCFPEYMAISLQKNVSGTLKRCIFIKINVKLFSKEQHGFVVPLFFTNTIPF